MNITFKRTSDMFETYCANWSDDKGRYHVWINEGGKPEDVIYMNPLQRPDGTHPSRHDADYFNTRKMDIKANKNSAIQREITVAIAKGALIKANQVRQAELDTIAAAQTAKLVNDRREQLNHIGNITGISAIHSYLKNATDEEIAALPSLTPDR